MTHRIDPVAGQAESVAVRRERGVIRRALANGTVTIDGLLEDVPDCLAEFLIVDVLRWQRFIGDRKLRVINRDALKEGLNLCVPLRVAGPRHVEFFARLAEERERGHAVYVRSLARRERRTAA